MFASLAVSDFRYLWVGSFAGHIGFWMGVVAQGWLAFELTGSATFLGLMHAASALPGLLFMLPSGVMADRWDRRAIVFYSNVAVAVVSLVLTAVVALKIVEPWQLVLLGALAAWAWTLNLPARHGLGPQLAGPRLTSNAVALSSLSFNASRVVGPALAGLLIASVGLVGCFIVQTLLAALGAGLTRMVSPQRGSGAWAERRSIVQNFLDGLRYTRNEPVLGGCTVVSTLHNLFGMIYAQLMPVFAGSVLGVGGAGLGALMTAVGLGAAVGALAAVALSDHPRKGIIVFSSSVAFSAAIVFFAASTWVPGAMAALAILGCTHAMAAIANHTILNIVVPEEYRGRINSIFILTWNVAPMVALPAGWLADQVGAPITVGASGALSILSMVGAAIWLAPVRKFSDEEYLAARGRRVSA